MNEHRDEQHETASSAHMCVGTVDDVKQSNSNTTAHKQAGRLRVNLYIYIYINIAYIYTYYIMKQGK